MYDEEYKEENDVYVTKLIGQFNLPRHLGESEFQYIYNRLHEIRSVSHISTEADNSKIEANVEVGVGECTMLICIQADGKFTISHYFAKNINHIALACIDVLYMLHDVCHTMIGFQCDCGK